MKDISHKFLEAEENHSAVENIAHVCHEANRAFCLTLGDISQVSWENAPGWQKDSARKGVIFHLTGDYDAAASHTNWMTQKLAEGWIYGMKKDPEAKTHPCILPFEKLPLAQQTKDVLFRSIVHTFKAAITGGN